MKKNMGIKSLLAFIVVAIAVIMPLGLSATEINNAEKSVVVFPDAALDTVIRTKLGLGADVPINKVDLDTITGTLNVSNKGITNLEGVQYIKNITSINAASNAALVDVPQLCGADKIANLTTLDFKSTGVTSTSFLSECTTLRDLNFYGADLHDLIGLENSPTLVSMNMGGQKSKSLKSVSNLTNLPNLAVFSIMNSGVEDFSGMDLSSTNLQKLFIPNNKIKDISNFADFTNQSQLSIMQDDNLFYDASAFELDYTIDPVTNQLQVTSDNALAGGMRMPVDAYVTLNEIDGQKITRNSDGDVIIKNPVRNRKVAPSETLTNAASKLPQTIWGTEPLEGDHGDNWEKIFVNELGVPIPPAIYPESRNTFVDPFTKGIYGPDGVTVYEDSTYLPETNEIVWRNVPEDVTELYFGWYDLSIYGPSNGNHTTETRGKIKIIIEESYEVKFDANGGTGTMANQLFDKDVAKELSENAFVNPGYTFTGWNTQADGMGTAYTNKQLLTNPNLTLYAQWERNNFVLNYHANTGEGVMEPVSIFEGETFTILDSVFTKDKHTFVGWNTKEDRTGQAFAANDILDPALLTKVLQGNITLYAQWDLNATILDPSTPTIPLVPIEPSTPIEPSIPTTPLVPLDPSTEVTKPTKPEVEEELEDTGVMSNILIYVVILGMTSAALLVKKSR